VSLDVLKDGKPPLPPRKATLGPGSAFGELALIQAGAAACTVRVPLGSGTTSGDASATATATNTGAQVYCLSRFDFRRTVARQQASKITDVKETLRRIELLEGLSDADLVSERSKHKVK
jgi:CRP-like cAMP-binding protein